MAREGHDDDAKQQISLGFAESRIGEAPPVTADNLIEAANLLLSMHEFDLATRYYEKAKQAGAADEVVGIGLANTYLAQGKTRAADAELAALGSDPASNDNYDYLLAQSVVYRQRHDDVNALAVLSRADALGARRQDAELLMQQVAGDEGYRVNDHLSLLGNFTMGGLYDDSTIYMLDQQIFRSQQQQPVAAAAALSVAVAGHGRIPAALQQFPAGERLLPDPQCAWPVLLAQRSVDHQPQHERLQLQQRDQSHAAHWRRVDQLSIPEFSSPYGAIATIR